MLFHVEHDGVMSRVLLALLLLFPLIASAQIQFSPTSAGAHSDLNGQTVSGSINIRLSGCATGPWEYSLDGAVTPQWTEYTCPYDYMGDDTLLDTKTLTNGLHTITAKGPSSTLTAKFTVANGAPVPPGGVQVVSQKFTWGLVTTCTDGTLCTVDAYRIECDPGISVVLPATVVQPYSLTGLTPSSSYSCVMAARLGTVWSDDSNRLTFTSVAATTPPPTCPAQPPPETRQQSCAPLIGAWSQSHGWISIAAPACWQADVWLPTQAPAGVCAAPSPLITAGPLSYFTAGTTMTSVGYVAAGLPCGPETKTVGGVKFCRITKDQTDLIGWPVPLAATDLWARPK